MTFKQAYTHAIKHSQEFREFDMVVRSKKVNDHHTKCCAFTTDLENVFYYGFDGIDIQKGKYSPKRAAQLLNSGSVDLIIL